MKEELNTLKESATEVIKAKDSFRKQKAFFNMKVEEQKAKLNIAEVFNDKNDSYDAATALVYHYPEIAEIVADIREEHPKYGVKRVKDLTVEELLIIRKDMLHEEDATRICPLIVDNYFLYENCGFFDLQEKELQIGLLEHKAKVAAGVVFEKSKKATTEAVKSAGQTVKKVATPYGDVAKSQFKDAKELTKDVVNKGAKKLVKVLENLEKKTRK